MCSSLQKGVNRSGHPSLVSSSSLQLQATQNATQYNESCPGCASPVHTEAHRASLWFQSHSWTSRVGHCAALPCLSWALSSVLVLNVQLTALLPHTVLQAQLQGSGDSSCHHNVKSKYKEERRPRKGPQLRVVQHSAVCGRGQGS